MKDNTKSQNDLKRLLETSDYNDIRVYLKQQKYLSKQSVAKTFWQSSLPINWFSELSKELFFEQLLFSYFKAGANANDLFLKCFLNSTKKTLLIKIIKLSGAFRVKSHWKTFSIFLIDVKLKIFYRELQYIKSYREYWKNESVKHEQFIKSVELQDILFHVVMAYQDFASQSSKAKGNNSLRVSHRSILIDLLNIILEIKYNHIISNKLKVENSNSVDYFQKVSVNDYQDLKNDFREVIEFYFAKHDCEYQINKYLTGFADFEYIDGLNSILKTNDEHSLYRKTLDKSKYDETYLTNRVIENSSQILDLKKLPSFWDKEFKLNLLSSIEYYKFLNIPLEISIDSKEIDLKKVLHLLKTFSLLFNPQPTTTFNGIALQRETPKNFSNLFYSDYIVSYEVSEFVNKCTNYFKWSKEEVKSILNFITTDFSIHQNIRVDLKMKPLVKIGNQYFWLSNFMKDIRWEIPLHRKLVADEVLNSQRISDLSEVDLANYFREAKFSAINGHKYYFDEINGEIDIIAYKDGVLFLCELKSTYVKEDIVRSSLFESRNFNFKASEQLDIAKEYVKNNFHKIKNIKELNVDCTLENLLIETIIVSNVYQSDHLLFNRRHMKVSQLELSIILRNDKYDMLVSKLGTAFFDSKLEIPIDKLMSLHEGNNSNIKEVDGQIQKEDCNLWSHKSYCSPQDLISAIKENKVWRHQDDYKDYHIEEIELGVYNKNYKYLA